MINGQVETGQQIGLFNILNKSNRMIPHTHDRFKGIYVEQYIRLSGFMDQLRNEIFSINGGSGDLKKFENTFANLNEVFLNEISIHLKASETKTGKQIHTQSARTTDQSENLEENIPNLELARKNLTGGNKSKSLKINKIKMNDLDLEVIELKDKDEVEVPIDEATVIR
ncbi:hypothetical protein Glove_13g269 [Diversispora epigaea]|uniref:Uncharacterized protein n=1 Tax=Diversispora epigaea TaxID=1348612 RepID=A0A397JMR3_9GLOM|nr:hypothetical protein Glove_13g269 [Diversispora epigaea]